MQHVFQKGLHVAALYALLSALAFGTGDFLGGFSSRRLSAIVVSFVSQVAGLIVVSGFLIIFARAGLPEIETVIWGAAAGVALGIGYLWYYRGLAIGHMGVVATDTAVWSALVPVAAGFIIGERPLLVADFGIAIVIVALILVGKTDTTEKTRPLAGLFRSPGRVQGVLAGVSYGFFFIFLDRADTGNPLWPLFVAIFMSTLILLLAMCISRPPWEPRSLNLRLLISIGVIQAIGQLSFIMATRTGLLSIVSVLAALSPVPTIVLARLILAQKLSRRQLIGVGTAILGIVLITSGG